MPIATPQGTLDFKSVDKVTFVGASSNTVIDTTTGSLGVGVGVGGPTSNLHVVGHTRLEGDIDMLHTSNTASIKLNSNVVTEFPRSKKLIKYPRVALTQNALNNGYAAEASTENNGTSSGQAYRLFDGIVSGERGYHSASTTYSSGSTYTGSASITDAYGIQHQGEWIKLQMPTADKIKLSGFSFSPRYVSTAEYHHRAPYKGVFLGSTDGTNWYPIHYFDNVTVPELTTVSRTFENTTNDYYNRIALVVYEVGPNATYGDVLNFAEMELYGIPEYDPEAHGTDVVVKSLPNVPNTDWLEVYYDAKDLADGAVTSVDDLTPSGTNDGTATNVTVSDGAFVFNGTSSLLESSTTITNSTGDIPHTFSLWVKPSEGDLDDTGNHYLIVYGTELDTGKWSGISISNERFASVIHASVVRFGPEIRVGEWYHIVLNYKSGGIHNSDRFDFFINGSQINTSALSTAGSQAGSATLNLSSPAKLVLGGLFNGSERSSSTIANARLFNRALTSDEVWQLYAYQKEYFGHGDLGMTLKAGRLGIGTSEPRAALDVRGDIYAPGTIVQVEQTVKTNPSAVTSTTEVDIGGLSVDITPKFGTSKVLVSYTVNVGVDITGTSNMHGFLRVKRTQGGISTYIGDGASSNSRQVCTSYIYNTVNNQCESFSFEHLDDANGIDTITYQIQGLVEASVYTMTINRSGSDGNNGYYGRTSSSITVKEVCQ